MAKLDSVPSGQLASRVPRRALQLVRRDQRSLRRLPRPVGHHLLVRSVLELDVEHRRHCVSRTEDAALAPVAEVARVPPVGHDRPQRVGTGTHLRRHVVGVVVERLGVVGVARREVVTADLHAVEVQFVVAHRRSVEQGTADGTIDGERGPHVRWRGEGLLERPEGRATHARPRRRPLPVVEVLRGPVLRHLLLEGLRLRPGPQRDHDGVAVDRRRHDLCDERQRLVRHRPLGILVGGHRDGQHVRPGRQAPREVHRLDEALSLRSEDESPVHVDAAAAVVRRESENHVAKRTVLRDLDSRAEPAHRVRGPLLVAAVQPLAIGPDRRGRFGQRAGDPFTLPVLGILQASGPRGGFAPRGCQASRVPRPHLPVHGLHGLRRLALVRHLGGARRVHLAGVPEVAGVCGQALGRGRDEDAVGGLALTAGTRRRRELPGETRLGLVHRERRHAILDGELPRNRLREGHRTHRHQQRRRKKGTLTEFRHDATPNMSPALTWCAVTSARDSGCALEATRAKRIELRAQRRAGVPARFSAARRSTGRVPRRAGPPPGRIPRRSCRPRGQPTGRARAPTR